MPLAVQICCSGITISCWPSLLATEAGKGAEFVVQPKSYIVIDIGGGTVDIVFHSIAEGHIVEIARPAGTDSANISLFCFLPWRIFRKKDR